MLSISQYLYELDKKEIIHMYLTLENIYMVTRYKIPQVRIGPPSNFTVKYYIENDYFIHLTRNYLKTQENKEFLI